MHICISHIFCLVLLTLIGGFILSKNGKGVINSFFLFKTGRIILATKIINHSLCTRMGYLTSQVLRSKTLSIALKFGVYKFLARPVGHPSPLIFDIG